MTGTVLLLVLAVCTSPAFTIHLPGTVNGHCILDIIILLDTSGSIKDDGGDANWGNVQRFTKRMVNAIDQETQVGSQTRIGITSFSRSVRRDLTLGQNFTRVEINNLIDNDEIEFQGSITRMYEAVEDVNSQFSSSARSDATKALILFTDGVPSDPSDSRETVLNVVSLLNEMMSSGIYVYMIGIHNVNDTMMNLIRQNRFGFAEKAVSFDDLGSNSFPDIVISNLHIRCVAADPSDCGLDVFLLVDSSGSIGVNTFTNDVKRFAKIMVDVIDERFGIDSGRTRMAVQTFSREATMYLSLEDGTNTEVIKQRIEDMNFQNSWTHLVEYTNQSRTQLLRGRNNVELRLLIISDGVPTHEDQRNRGETVDKLVELIRDMKNSVGASRPIYTSVVGFSGEKAPNDVTPFLERLEGIAHLTNVLRDYNDELSLEAARDTANEMGNHCPEQPDICLITVTGPTDLVIVVDDTTDENFDESRRIAQEMIDELRPYIIANKMTIQVASSNKLETIDGITNVNDVITPRGNGNLLDALTLAHRGIVNPPVIFEIIPERHKVVLVIHSGHLEYAPSTQDMSSAFKRVVYQRLKFNGRSQVHSLRLSSTNKQGEEILKRLHTQPEGILNENANYVQYLRDSCPRVYTCEDIDVALLLDVSGSTDLEDVKNHAIMILEFLKSHPTVRDARKNVALVSFAEFVNIHFDLEEGNINNDKVYDALMTTIERLEKPPQTMTNIGYALSFIARMVFNSHGDRDSGTDHIIVFTDGQTNMFENSGGVDELRTLRPNIAIFHQGDMDVIQDYYNTLPRMNEANFREVLGSEIFGNRDCLKSLDPINCRNLMILMDASGSVKENFEQIKTFVIKLINEYHGERAGQGRLGVVSFSNQASVIVPFALHYSNFSKAVNETRETKSKDGKTNLNQALQLARTSVRDLRDSTDILVINDGEHNEGGNPRDTLISMLRDGFTIHAVFTGDKNEANKDNMIDIIGSENVREVALFSQLADDTNVNWVFDNRVCRS